jgi:hypothetical protein
MDEPLGATVQVLVTGVLRGTDAAGRDRLGGAVALAAVMPGATGVTVATGGGVVDAGTASTVVEAESAGALAGAAAGLAVFIPMRGLRVAGADSGDLQEDVTEGARDNRADQSAGGGIGDQGLSGEAGGGPHAVGREGREGEAPTHLALLRRRHLNSSARGLV